LPVVSCQLPVGNKKAVGRKRKSGWSSALDWQPTTGN
jgi:hypothetical protein